MSKILKNWVGEEELRKTAVRNVGTPWYDMDTGEQMGYAEWKPAVMEETGGEFLMMKHEDVHRLLHTLAIAAGAKIQFGATVTSVTPGDPKPSVTLATGETLTADIVIGADGPTSMVRRMVLDREDDAEPGGFTVFGGSVSADEMKKYPELEKWATSEEPGGTHGPAMALEDAVVFSTLFSHLKSWNQVGSFVSAYQEIREARTKAVNTVDVSNAELVRMPPGPDRDRRNESMRRARREWDDDALQWEFEGVAALFAYEAQDAAEEWWVNWGRFKEINSP
ncbi:hypothetical protein EW026_g7146 [Hermanssonia centrifuga]|uniref:FAD-binding domain-containing protein n=1 Tax=Hermanssonia centrifuga TaxID=98765 RepID=A0A4S4K9T7_9APHY|nr:hypothetical protein EW026_g7146 [Hermanssonia centrifuga]